MHFIIKKENHYGFEIRKTSRILSKPWNDWNQDRNLCCETSYNLKMKCLMNKQNVKENFQGFLVISIHTGCHFFRFCYQGKMIILSWHCFTLSTIKLYICFKDYLLNHFYLMNYGFIVFLDKNPLTNYFVLKLFSIFCLSIAYIFFRQATSLKSSALILPLSLLFHFQTDTPWLCWQLYFILRAILSGYTNRWILSLKVWNDNLLHLKKTQHGLMSSLMYLYKKYYSQNNCI